MGKGLIIDTSQTQAFLLLTEEEMVIDFFIFYSLKCSATLSSKIKSFLEKSQTSLKDLSYIGVGTGPGAFLGTRIGVITAKSLSYALDIPLITFCSLKAYTLPSEDFIVIADAKSEGCYLLEGDHPRLCKLEDLPQNISLICPPEDNLLKKVPGSLTAHFNFSSLCKDLWQKKQETRVENKDEVAIIYLR